MALGDGIGRNKGINHWSYGRKRDYKAGIDALANNLIRNSRTEIIDDKICLIVTDDRIKTIVEEMKRQIDN